MTRHMIRGTMVAGLFAAAFALPAAAGSNGPVPGPDLDRARSLRAQAEALFDQPKAWKKVARLLEESAALRTADDAEAYECLLYAGRIRATLGDAKGATKILERAAEHALARGALVEAAQAYVDAAFSAQAAGELQAAVGYAEKVRLLASSPLLPEHDRSSLLTRVN